MKKYTNFHKNTQETYEFLTKYMKNRTKSLNISYHDTKTNQKLNRN